MNRLLCVSCCLGLFAIADFASAKTWAFERSYYTHDPVRPVTIGRQSAGLPAYGVDGGFVRAGYRYVNEKITVGGKTYDHAHSYESWFQTGPAW